MLTRHTEPYKQQHKQSNISQQIQVVGKYNSVSGSPGNWINRFCTVMIIHRFDLSDGLQILQATLVGEALAWFQSNFIKLTTQVHSLPP